MTAPKGFHVIKNALTLAGMIIYRTFIPHDVNRIPDSTCFVNMKMIIIFILMSART
jgi:hypothetical protein